VPCGAATERLLEADGIQAEPDTLATDVKEATALVSLGEVDAAVVYRTDAVAEGDAVETIDVPQAAEVVNDYPVALVRGGPNPEAAQVVVEAITGELGQAILAEAGFLGP
jgi:molybdate transport system substrate-binding protein